MGPPPCCPPPPPPCHPPPPPCHPPPHPCPKFPRKSEISQKIRNFPENPKFPRKSEISPKIRNFPEISQKIRNFPENPMMMTIWWSKATRLLEFSRSCWKCACRRSRGKKR